MLAGRETAPTASARRMLGVATASLLTCGGPVAAEAQTAVPAAVAPPDLGTVEVIGTTPLQGSGLDRNKVPANTSVLTTGDLERTGAASLLRGLDEQVGGVDLDDAVGNPFQPNLLYRGFEASPLAGDAQGLAVYVNGARFNSSFADTVNFDFIPDIAVARAELVGSNPAFGLNALGGALSVKLKDGFSYHGGEAEVSGGSFGRIQLSGQYGLQADDVAMYVAVTGSNEDGWREDSPSQIRQLYADLGWRGDKAELHVNVTAADDDLLGNGTTPVELLAADRAAVFTYPDETRNKYERVVASLDYAFSDSVSLQGAAYYSNFSQRTFNGDAGDQAACPDGVLVCNSDSGEKLTVTGGAYIPNFARNSPYNVQPGFVGQFDGGGPYSVLNRTATDSNSFGASAQATDTGEVLGRANHAVFGLSYDGGRSRFAADTLLGGLTLDRDFAFPPGGTSYELNLADGSVTPVRVATSNDYYGVFAADTFDITPLLSATVSGRFNSAQIDLVDQLGTALNGQHSYNRFNPAIGLTWQITPELSVYAGYAESNRAPTPSELSCASAAAPCSLTNFFVGDPDLKQVVGHTWEAGFNGHMHALDGRLDWHAGYFRTSSDDDIILTSSATVGRAFFQNVGQTLRQGAEASLHWRDDRLFAYASYQYIEATFRNDLTLGSSDNPFADAGGDVAVHPGDSLPGIPRHTLKFGLDCKVTPAWDVGFTGKAASGEVLFGDESNQNPRTGSYVVFGFNTSYQVTSAVQVFGQVVNALDARYETYGTFSPTGSVPLLQAPGAANPRSVTPGAPVAGFAGVRVTF